MDSKSTSAGHSCGSIVRPSVSAEPCRTCSSVSDRMRKIAQDDEAGKHEEHRALVLAYLAEIEKAKKQKKKAGMEKQKREEAK